MLLDLYREIRLSLVDSRAVTVQLAAGLVERVLSCYPLPIADATAALVAAESPFERRDRVVEVFRAALRYLAALTLAARVQYGPGPGAEGTQVGELLRALRSRGLTDGQWFAVVREMLRPWSSAPDGHPLPALVRLVHGKKPELPKLVDELLLMRKSETVAHGASGTKAALIDILARRTPQLARLLELLDPLWSDARLVAPLAPPESDDEPQMAQLLMGDTPNRGRWRCVELPGPTRLPAGECVIASAEKAVLALHPLVLFRRPGPEAVEELFALDGGTRRGAAYVALPSMAEHRETEVWTRLERALLGEAAEGAEDAPGGLERPFRGLASFGPEHAALFFGREEQAEALANRIRREAIVTVTGPSGSGKTSLLRAGALPQLGDCKVAVLRPGADPVGSLASALTDALAGWPGADEIAAAARRDAREIAGVVARWGREGGGLLVVVVDQAEELLTLCDDEARRAAFGEAIAAIALSSAGAARAVFSVREDFFGRLAMVPALRGLYSRQVEVVTTPDRDALARTLYAPVRHFGYAFEDEALVLEMVGAAFTSPAALALLQFCADRLWDARDRTWKRLTWDAYRALGGVEGALAAHADRTFEALTPSQRRACRELLLRLVTAERTRAIVPRHELLEAAVSTEDAAMALDQLVAARLLTTSEADSSGEARVEIVHEALIRHWAALDRWLSEDEHGQRLLHALRQAAQEWSQRGKSRGLLWRGDMLEELRVWRRRGGARLTGGEAAFAAASEADERRNRRLRRLLVGAALVGTSVFAAFMFFQWQRAEEARARAEVRGLVAQARVHEPARRTGKALALFRAAAEVTRPEDGIDVSVDLERLRRAGAGARVLTGHTAPVWLVEPSPDGSRLATASIDGSARIWDHRTGVCLHVLGGHGHIVEAMAFSPDGRTLVTGSGDLKAPRGFARLYDVPTGELRLTLEGHGQPVHRARIAPDGRTVVTASRDGTVRLHDALSGEPIRVLTIGGNVADLAVSRDGAIVAAASGDSAHVYSMRTGARVASVEGHRRAVTRIAISPDGELLATASADGIAGLWDARSGELLRRLDHDDDVRAVAFSPDGAVLATGSADRTARSWDVATGAPLHVLVGHAGAVATLTFSPEGDRLATASDDTARVWDTRTGALLEVLEGHEDVVHHLAFGPGGDEVFTASADKTARVWRADRGPAALFAGHTAEVRDVAVSADGGRVITASSDGTARVWDPTTSGSVAELRGHRGPIEALALSTDGARVATASKDRTARVWSIPGGNAIATLKHERAVTAVAFSPDGARVATAAEDGGAIWRAESGERLVQLSGHEQGLTAIRFAPDGARVVTASKDRTARIWDSATGAAVATLAGHEGQVTTVAYSHRSGRIATASRHTARVWDAATGKDLAVMSGHEQAVTALAFSPDDSLLVTASKDERVRTYRVDSGELVHVFRGHTGVVLDAAFSPDGARIVSTSSDGTARVWDAASGAVLEVLHAHAPRAVTAAAFSASGDLLVTGGADGLAAAFRAPGVDGPRSLVASGLETNLRVCRRSFEVIAVLPFPPGETAWAPESQCPER